MDDGPDYDPGGIRDDKLPEILRTVVHRRGQAPTFANACLLAADRIEELEAEVERLKGEVDRLQAEKPHVPRDVRHRADGG